MGFNPAFPLARLFGWDGVFRKYSCAKAELLKTLEGKSVAIVGNARSLARSNHGAEIEKADLVVRINRAPMPDPRSHGKRTDWLGLATSLGRQDLLRIKPKRILWMSHKRKRLRQAIARTPGFYLSDKADWRRLGEILGAPPSTGVMLIDLVAQSNAASVQLYGFDFFASKSLSGRRDAAQVPHDFDVERRFVERLCSADPRFSVIT